MRVRVLCLFAAFLLAAAPAAAQITDPVPPPVVVADAAPNANFRIGFFHKAEATTKFRVWVNDKIVKNYLPGELTKIPGTDGLSDVQVTVPGLAAGTYRLAVSAYNDFGDSPKFEIPLVVGAPPEAGTGLRVIKTTTVATTTIDRNGAIVATRTTSNTVVEPVEK